MSLYSQLFLRDTNSPYGDVNRNSTLSFKDLDQNFLFLKERDINQLRVVGSDLIYETLGGTEYSVNIGGASSNTFVTGFTFNSPSTYDLTIEQNGGEIPLTVDLSSLASDVYVLSGSYDPSTGDVEFTNSTGGTFIVSGFTTGMTDTFVTGGTLTGTNLVLEKSNGVDTSAIDLSSLSGDTPSLQQVMDVGSTYSGPDTVSITSTSGSDSNAWSLSPTTYSHTITDGTNTTTVAIGDDVYRVTSLVDATGVGGTLRADVAQTVVRHDGTGTTLQDIYLDGTQMLITDTINTKGLEYAADYSSNFTNESLVTKRYVTGVTSNFAIVGTYTDGYVPRWNSTLNTLESGSIQDSGSNVHVGGSPDSTAKLKVSKGSGTDEGIYVDVSNGGGNGARIEMKNSSGTTNQTGLYVRNFSNSSASGDIRGINILTETDTTSKTINNVFGIHAQNMDLNANTTVNNLYQLFLGDAGSAVKGTGEFYGIRQVATNVINRFSGGMRFDSIGSTTPVTNLGIDASGNVVSGTTGLSIGNPITGGGANRILYQNASQLLTSDDDLLFDGLGFALHTSIDSNKAMSLNGGTSSHYTTLYVQQGSTGTANRYAIEAVGVAGHAFDSVGIKSTAQNTSTGDAIAGEFSATAPTGSGNAYGIKVTSSNVGTGIAYGIYQSGTTAINYFAGQLQLNTIGSGTSVTNLGVDASGNVVSGTTGGGGGEINTASNIGGGEGLFSGKSGVDLQFKSLTSTGGTVTITSTGSTVNLESSGGGGLNYISAGAVATNLETTSNWDINGVYTGATATGSQGDCHVDSNYWFTCVATDTWIRLIRG